MGRAGVQVLKRKDYVWVVKYHYPEYDVWLLDSIHRIRESARRRVRNSKYFYHCYPIIPRPNRFRVQKIHVIDELMGD